MPNKQIRNIASVIAYIEAHLTQKLNLDILAEAMHYSKYHLHRIFTDTVGPVSYTHLDVYKRQVWARAVPIKTTAHEVKMLIIHSILP